MTRVGDVLQGSMLEEQMQLETEAVTRGVARYRRLAQEAIDRNDGASLKPAERLVAFWVPDLAAVIRAEQRAIAGGKAGKGRAVYGPVLLRLDADRLAVIAIHEMLSRCMAKPNGETVLKMTYGIGSAVLAEIHHDMMRGDEKSNRLAELERKFKNVTPQRINAWANKTLEDSLWDRTVCTHIGAILVDKVMSVAVIEVKGSSEDEDQWVAAFERMLVYKNNRRTGTLTLTNNAKTMIEDGHLFRQSLRPRYLPMIVPPYPWTEDAEGGYTRIRTPFISKPTSDQRFAIASSPKHTLYEGLNAINSTPWQINARMVDLQKEIYKSGGGVGIPKDDVIPMPPKPSDIETNEDSLNSWKAEAHEIHSMNAKLKGARIEFLQRHSVAEMFRNYPSLWYPNIFDFRYRHYPLPATSPNHHGPDASRSLMLFGNKVKLTDAGRRWLYIQAANHWGHDKHSFDKRIEWVESSMRTFETWARRPMDTIHEWGAAEEPLQFINCVWALFDTDMASQLPGHVDGSCNVIQHYSAIGRDPMGAQKVNMIPNDQPHDPYQDAVGLVVQELVSRHAKGDQLAAQVGMYLKDEKVARKICKRPAMTSQYNSTKVGARNQVHEELVKIGVPRDIRRKHANYLADTIYDQVGVLFPAATSIMRWLEACARMMCKARPEKSIGWTSPLGVKVVQPYRNPRKFRISTIVQDIPLGHRDVDSPVSLLSLIHI